MTATTETESPEKPTATGLLRGFSIAVGWGAGLACLVVGPVVGRSGVTWTGGGLILAAVVVSSLLRRARGERDAGGERIRPVPRTPELALARIESRRATGADSADVPVEFLLTVAPDDRPAYRVKITQSVNLVDLGDYKPRGIVVVKYHPDALWKVELVAEPDEEWARRAAAESVDSAPEDILAAEPDAGCASCLVGLVGLLVGAAIVVMLYRGELFEDDGDKAASARTTATATASGITVPETMLEPGEMRRGTEQLIAMMGTDKAVEFSIDEDHVSAQAVKTSDPKLVDSYEFEDGGARLEGPRGTRPTANPEPLIDLRALPFEQLPGLVAEAKTTLGITTPKGWHISVEHDPVSGLLHIRVLVTDDYGTVALIADASGQVVERSPR